MARNGGLLGERPADLSWIAFFELKKGGNLRKVIRRSGALHNLLHYKPKHQLYNHPLSSLLRAATSVSRHFGSVPIFLSIFFMV